MLLHLGGDVLRGGEEGVAQPPGDDGVGPGPIRGEHRGHVTRSPPITAHLEPAVSHSTAYSCPAERGGTGAPSLQARCEYYLVTLIVRAVGPAGDGDIHRGEDEVEGEGPGERGRHVVVAGLAAQGHSCTGTVSASTVTGPSTPDCELLVFAERIQARKRI